jgi:hypothetical protein
LTALVEDHEGNWSLLYFDSEQRQTTEPHTDNQWLEQEDDYVQLLVGLNKLDASA